MFLLLATQLPYQVHLLQNSPGDVPTSCPVLDTRTFLVWGILVKAAVNICGQMPLLDFIPSLRVANI